MTKEQKAILAMLQAGQKVKEDWKPHINRLCNISKKIRLSEKG